MRKNQNVLLDVNVRSAAAEEFYTGVRRRIVGQDPAVDAVSDIYQMVQAGLMPPGRPVGNLLFLGPTGSGKTRLVEAVAEVLFGTPLAHLRIDCAEFQHSHEIAKLIGSPPGYLGHRETHALLTQEALSQWHTETLKLSLVLFDEIEKASDALWRLLLGVLDKATLTLGDNRRVDLSRCLIFMTSNLGTAEMNALTYGGLGFAHKSSELNEQLDKQIDRTAIESARRKFSPEFVNRIDKMIVFHPLRPQHLKQILELELCQLQHRILSRPTGSQFVFTCVQAVKDFLLQEGCDPRYGARHLKRAIEKYLVCPLANLSATGQIGLGDVVSIHLGDQSHLTFVKEADGSLLPQLIARCGSALSSHTAVPLAAGQPAKTWRQGA